MLKQLVKS